MKRIWVLLFFLFSCNEKEKVQENIISYANFTLSNSNMVIDKAIDDQLSILIAKLRKPTTHDSAQVFYSKAMNWIEISNKMEKLLQNLLNVVSERGGLVDKNGLFEKLKTYEMDFLKIDEFAVQEIFQRNLFSIYKNGGLDSMTEVQFNDKFIKGSSKSGCITLINSIITNVKCNEILFLRYAINRSSVLDGGGLYNNMLKPLISQNSKKLKANETLEILAGVGEFSLACSPKVEISGKTVLLDGNGIAKISIKVPNDSGRYTIPVKITYRKPTDGKLVAWDKEIEYSVEK